MRHRIVILEWVVIILCGMVSAARGDALTDQAAQAAAGGKLGEFIPAVERELEPYLAALDKPDLPNLTRLAALREFARYFARLEEPTPRQAQVLQWLAAQPSLMQSLMMAISPSDRPDKVLDLLISLRQGSEKDRLADFPELVAALCVVWDAPARAGAESENESKPEAAPALSLFRYYSSARAPLRFDPKTLPSALLVYVVDNQAGPDEILWAGKRYAKRGSIGSAFFDVTYDYGLYGGNDSRLKDQDYTLQNILRLGGICGDQAYFATQVARSIGVPATICTGTGAFEGTGHAWVGFLDSRGSRAAWNFEQGRYPENMYWKGRVIDPQTRQQITDADVALLAELQDASPRDRLGSEALCKLADLVPETNRSAVLMQAVNLSCGNPRAWRALADMGARGKLSPESLRSLHDAVIKLALKRYPDFALAVLVRAYEGRGTAQQVAMLGGLRGLFPNRPDLQADICIRQGDLYRREGRHREALGAYTDVLDRHLNLAPIVLETMDHVDDLLRDQRDLRQLASIYQTVWQRMPQPEASIAVQGTPFYRIGTRYRQVLEELDQRSAAATVQGRLDSLSASIAALRK